MINNDVIPQLQQHFHRKAGGAFRNLCGGYKMAPRRIVWLQFVSVYENCLVSASLTCIIMWNGPWKLFCYLYLSSVEHTGSKHCPTCMVIMLMNSISFMRIITIANCAMFVSSLFKMTEPKIVYSTE